MRVRLRLKLLYYASEPYLLRLKVCPLLLLFLITVRTLITTVTPKISDFNMSFQFVRGELPPHANRKLTRNLEGCLG